MGIDIKYNDAVVYSSGSVVFKTPRLDSPDLNQIVKWLNDKRNLQFSNQRYLRHTIDSQVKYIKETTNGNNLYLTCFVNGKLVGTISIVINQVHKVAEIRIFLPKKFSGKGIGSMLVGETIIYINKQLDIKQVRGGCSSTNLGMKRVFEKNNFSLETVDEEIINSKSVKIEIYSKFLI